MYLILNYFTIGWIDNFQLYSSILAGTLHCKSFKNFWKLIFPSELGGVDLIGLKPKELHMSDFDICAHIWQHH